MEENKAQESAESKLGPNTFSPTNDIIPVVTTSHGRKNNSVPKDPGPLSVKRPPYPCRSPQVHLGAPIPPGASLPPVTHLSWPLTLAALLVMGAQGRGTWPLGPHPHLARALLEPGALGRPPDPLPQGQDSLLCGPGGKCCPKPTSTFSLAGPGVSPV